MEAPPPDANGSTIADISGLVWLVDVDGTWVIRLSALNSPPQHSADCRGHSVLIGIASAGLVAQQAPGGFPDAVSADPAHYSVSFENEIVRLVRVRYAPDERSVMHRHFASCVIFLTGQTFNFTLPDGETAPASVSAGALGCGDGNVHLPENIAHDPAEFIMVEFKNRETFRK